MIPNTIPAAGSGAFSHAPRSADGSDAGYSPTLLMLLTGCCAVSGVGAYMLHTHSEIGERGLFLVAYITGGWAPVKAVLRNLLDRRLDVNLLMVLAAIGAAVTNDWGEGAALLFLFSLSGALEKITLERTARSIEALIELRPDTALVIRNGTEQRVAINEIQRGERVRILPAERLPIDGIVVEGETSVDQSTITGESMPVDKAPGDEVFAGTLNQRGSIVVDVRRTADETMLAKIVRTVRDAQDEKADSERFIQRWQKPYVICVLAGSVAVLGFHMLFPIKAAGASMDGSLAVFSAAFKQAMVLLVGASPCAVVIAVPAATLAGITRAARSGVLFKGGAFLEKLADARVIVFDKTGTLTEGKPAVVSVWNAKSAAGPAVLAETAALDADTQRLLQLAACVEQRSEHPLARAIVDAGRARGVELSDVREFESHTGLGAHAEIGELWIGVGKPELFATHQIRLPEELLRRSADARAAGQTVLLVGTNQGDFGMIAVADRTRAEAKAVIDRLRKLHVEHVAVLTGDHRAVAEAVAKSVGADHVSANLLPQEKVTEIALLRRKYGQIVMVGDGVNDAPALAVADVGIAMGGAGTDVALETADAVLMKDNLSGVVTALWISQATRTAIARGLTFAFVVIAILIIGAMLNILPLWVAVLCHEGSTVLTILSGLYILVENPPTELGLTRVTEPS
jgi:Cd2+/Zn2+-exporting ATPase